MSKARPIGNPLCYHAECPVWSERYGRLFWADVLESRIWWHDPATNTCGVLFRGSAPIGALVEARDGMLLAGEGNRLVRLDPKRPGWVEPVLEIPMADDERFNDAAVDARGRLVIGTLTPWHESASLWLIERGCDPVRLKDRIGISNGPVFSPDGRIMYHTDSRLRRIYRHGYDPAAGQITSSDLLLQCTDPDGIPDGSAVDQQGCLWVACWDGSQVMRVSPDGTIMERHPIPALQVSSVAFGGALMDRLYVTTSQEGSANRQEGLNESGFFLGGLVYALAVGTSGMPVPLCEV